MKNDYDLAMVIEWLDESGGAYEAFSGVAINSDHRECNKKEDCKTKYVNTVGDIVDWISVYYIPEEKRLSGEEILEKYQSVSQYVFDNINIPTIRYEVKDGIDLISIASKYISRDEDQEWLHF